MPVRVTVGDVFESEADGLVLSIDGLRSGMEGQVARAFAQRWPEAWRWVEQGVEYPLELGQAQCVVLDEAHGCPFEAVILVSTLHHLDVLGAGQKQRLVSKATTNAVKAAVTHQFEAVATTVMSGGWRLSMDQALVGMMAGFKASLPQSRGVWLDIHGLDPQLKAIARRLGLP